MKNFILILFIAANTFAMMPENSSFNLSAETIRIPKGATLFDKICHIQYQFIMHSESVVGHKISEQFNMFQVEYDNGKSVPISLNELSPRSCIELFRQILNYKLTRFPENSNYWDRDEQGYIDKVPTLFQLGSSQYRVISMPTENQPGNFKLEVRIDKIDKSVWEYHNWPQIFYTLRQIIKESGENLLTTSRPLNYFHDRIVNECKILLYFEVARRLINGDKYENLPIAVFLPYLLKNFKDCEALFVPQEENNWSSLFFGDERVEIAQNFALQLKTELWERRWIGLRDIREILSALHYDEEDSDCEYVED